MSEQKERTIEIGTISPDDDLGDTVNPVETESIDTTSSQEQCDAHTDSPDSSDDIRKQCSKKLNGASLTPFGRTQSLLLLLFIRKSRIWIFPI